MNYLIFLESLDNLHQFSDSHPEVVRQSSDSCQAVSQKAVASSRQLEGSQLQLAGNQQIVSSQSM